MTYRNDWQQQRPISDHSTKELEHRLTLLEDAREASLEERGELYKITDQHREKLTLHEKAILLILGAMGIFMQDKFPAIAAMLKRTIP